MVGGAPSDGVNIMQLHQGHLGRKGSGEERREHPVWERGSWDKQGGDNNRPVALAPPCCLGNETQEFNLTAGFAIVFMRHFHWP